MSVKRNGLVFEDIRLFSNKRPVFYFAGHDAEHPVRNVVIRNFRLNGQPLRPGDYKLAVEEFCENVSLEG